MSVPHGGYPLPGQGYGPVPRQKVAGGILVGVSLWRLVIVASAFIGFGAAVAEFGLGGAMPGLSQQASLLTGVVYLGLVAYPVFTSGRRHEPCSPWVRGAVAVLLLLVGFTYLTVMAGALDETWAVFEHVLTPLLVLVDWVAIGRNQARVKWWHPLTWVVFPLAYLGYFLLADVSLYHGFLDPGDDDFAVTVFGFLVAVVATGYVLYGVAKMKTVISAGTRQQYPPPAMPYPPQYPPQQAMPYPQQSPYPPQPQGWDYTGNAWQPPR